MSVLDISTSSSPVYPVLNFLLRVGARSFRFLFVWLPLSPSVSIQMAGAIAGAYIATTFLNSTSGGDNVISPGVSVSPSIGVFFFSPTAPVDCVYCCK